MVSPDAMRVGIRLPGEHQVERRLERTAHIERRDTQSSLTSPVTGRGPQTVLKSNAQGARTSRELALQLTE